MKTLLTKKRANEQVNAMLKFRPASAIELEAIGDKPEGYVAGWASTPDLDSYLHVVKVGAFDKSIKSRGLRGAKSIKLLLNHNWEKVAGMITVLETRGDSLWIEAQMNLNVSYVKDMYELLKMSEMNFSVGFMLEEYSWKVNANKVEYLSIEEGDLFEVSIVPFAGNEEATMEYVKSMEKSGSPATLSTVAEFEKLLVTRELVKSRTDAHAITLAVKEALHLFKAQPDGSREEPGSLEEPPLENEPSTPVLDVDQLTAALALAKKLTQTLTSS